MNPASPNREGRLGGGPGDQPREDQRPIGRYPPMIRRIRFQEQFETTSHRTDRIHPRYTLRDSDLSMPKITVINIISETNAAEHRLAILVAKFELLGRFIIPLQVEFLNSHKNENRDECDSKD